MSRRRQQVSTVGKQSREDDDDLEFYDELEQEEQINNIQRSITNLARKYAIVNNTLGYLLSAVYGGFAFFQIVRPFSLRHHALFEGSVDHGASISLGELSSALTLLLSTVTVGGFLSEHILEHHSPSNPASWKYAFNCSIMLAGIQLLYWMAAFVSLQQFRNPEEVAWGLIWWKPVIPLVWFLMSTRMIDGISKLQIDLGKMYRLKYRYKKL